MKRIMIAMALVVLMAVPAGATHYFALWNSRTSATVCEYWGEARHFVNVWVIPDATTGARAGEYKLLCPEGDFRHPTDPQFDVTREVKAPIMSDVMLGNLIGPPGCSIIFDCQYSPAWLYELRIDVEEGPIEQGYYTINPHNQTGLIKVVACVPYEEQLAVAYNVYGYNNACFTSTQESSWGAIKNLMK